MSALKYFLVDSIKNKAGLNQLGFIGALLQEKVKNKLFMKLYSRYAYYFTEYLIYFGRSLRLLKYMYRMTNYGKLFTD